MKTLKEIFESTLDLTEAKKVRIHLTGQGSDAKYSIIDRKTNKELMINIGSESEARKTIKKNGWSVGAGITRLDEAKIMVLDTLAQSESNKIKDALKKDGIKFKETGSIISIEIDPASSKAAVLKSHLHKIAKFDELREGSALDRYKAAKAKSGGKSSFECMECGAKFSKKIPKSGEVKCPKCGSFDVEVA